MRVLALLDGTLADPEAPLLRADDLGPTRGDGVFETLLVVDRQIRELDPHLDRMVNSARLLDIPLPDRAGWERAARAVMDAWPWDTERELSLKFVCTRGVQGGDGTPTAYAMGMPVGADARRMRAEGVSAISLDRGYSPDLKDRAPWLLLSAKTLSYAVNMAAMREAEARGADDVLFLASDGSVLEGPTSTAVIARGRRLITTPPSAGILPGTTQSALFRAAERAGWQTAWETFSLDDLLHADGAWLASSVRLIAQLNSVDGVRVGTNPDLHAEITKLYEEQY